VIEIRLMGQTGCADIYRQGTQETQENLKMDLKEQDVAVWTGFTQHKIGSAHRNFLFHNLLYIICIIYNKCIC
jgi:hypothetical protein